MELKRAADRCDWGPDSGKPDEVGPTSAFVHTMLLAMTIESLLKGGIVLHRGSQIVEDKNGRLRFHRKFKSHKLHKLAARLSPEFEATQDELELLEELVPFVEWSARYPGPLDSESYAPVGFSSPKRAAALAFHARLRAHLESFGDGLFQMQPSR